MACAVPMSHEFVLCKHSVVSCILWEGCAGCNVMCVFSWFWQEYSYLLFLCSELNCISLAIACLFRPLSMSAIAVYQMLYGYHLICSQTENFNMDVCRYSKEQVFFCVWLISAEESGFFPATSVSLMKDFSLLASLD